MTTSAQMIPAATGHVLIRLMPYPATTAMIAPHPMFAQRAFARARPFLAGHAMAAMAYAVMEIA